MTKSEILDAAEALKEFCNGRNCLGCMFNIGYSDCMLYDDEPCEWDLERIEREEHDKADLIDRNALLAAIYDNPPEKADMTHAEWYLKCIHEAPTIAQNGTEITAPPKTNADRIRQMTDEELATFLNDVTDCCSDGYICEKCPLDSAGKHCNIFTFEKWLKQEAEDESEVSNI